MLSYPLKRPPVEGSDDGLRFSPTPGTYVAVRLNPVEMVQHLSKDIDALRAAESIYPKVYIVYLEQELDFPWPNKPWYRFNVSPIGPHPPPPDPVRGYTSDTCVPIFPNSSHPSGAEPINPERPFPYHSCYHWPDNEMHVRVRSRPRPEEFDENNAVALSVKSQLKRMRMMTTLVMCAIEGKQNAEKARKESAAPNFEGHIPSVPSPATAQPLDRIASSEEPMETPEHARLEKSPEFDRGSCSSRSSHYDSEYSVNSVEDNMAVDVLTGPGEDLEVCPLVDLWIDLAENLKERDIGSPPEFVRECEMAAE
ncbi:hypothetical protein BD413DRAFT_472360 [Trametes elegans]|nr:hypothetical protein BD413DRAFT_472360 [Trametes elegans]